MTRIAAPALTVLIVVAAFVGLAGWNRSDQRLTITLTERELPLPRLSPDDGLGVRLRIAFENRLDPLDARNWLSEPRLRAIGFPLNVPAGAPEAAAAYSGVPTRVAWVVFEYDGAAFQEIERRRALRTPLEQRVERTGPRLVPVDAGLDFDTLRDKYGPGHLILRAVIGLVFLGSSSGGPLVYGSIRELVPPTVTVPRQLVPTLEGLAPRMFPVPSESGMTFPEPRYEVDLAVGRLGIPFVRGLRRVGG